MRNLLLEPVEYKIERTRRGAWRRFVYPDGRYFAEFKTHATFLGWPWLHYTAGVCPETGRRIMAKGVLAIGRSALGGLAVGQAAFGVIAIGQLAVGLGLGLGQAASGVIAIGQAGIAGLFGLGQIATGMVAIGQLGVGRYVLAQWGFGEHVWQQHGADPQAMEFFRNAYEQVSAFFN
ncbi:MAG: hypothetical protein H6970_10140 [Gammaproteobacteria bacterium]|nr:hypothetical protein [Gammaproteobacteria bacterium]MCP5425410.1 hypothetical protein [Gammaproteobacteria bacterium]MCP5459262.1 hypothetical protein [Gammaproteobacteria bacterium]